MVVNVLHRGGNLGVFHGDYVGGAPPDDAFGRYQDVFLGDRLSVD